MRTTKPGIGPALPLLLPLILLAAPAAAQEEPTAFQRQAALFAQHCMKCHTVGMGDRVGPDLRNVSERRDRDWLIGFIRAPSAYLDSDEVAKKLLAQFADVRMPDLGLTVEQAESLIEFIGTMSSGPAGGPGAYRFITERAPAEKVAGPDELDGIWVGGLALFAVLVALVVASGRAGRPRSAQIMLVIAIGVAYWSLGGRRYHHAVGNDQGYAPVQPVNFSHALHSGEMGISCLYCHGGAEKSPVAGIPAVSTCMNCHQVVKKRTTQTEPSPEIAKIEAAWNTPGSIEWVRVHRLPDFVFFDHQAHVGNNIQCQECHGPVETMARLRQASGLTMGWCVNCHRRSGPGAPSHWKRAGATLDCSACHQ